MQWNKKKQNKTKQNKKQKNTGNHIEKEGTIYFFNHIIVLNLNDKIMEKEPVRELTPFQCDGTKKQLGTT